MVVLIIIEELMSKTQDEFLDSFARLGVFSKVQALAGADAGADVDVIRSGGAATAAATAATPPAATVAAEAAAVVKGKTILAGF